MAALPAWRVVERGRRYNEQSELCRRSRGTERQAGKGGDGRRRNERARECSAAARPRPAGVVEWSERGGATSARASVVPPLSRNVTENARRHPVAERSSPRNPARPCGRSGVEREGRRNERARECSAAPLAERNGERAPPSRNVTEPERSGTERNGA